MVFGSTQKSMLKVKLEHQCELYKSFNEIQRIKNGGTKVHKWGAPFFVFFSSQKKGEIHNDSSCDASHFPDTSANKESLH